MQSPRELRRRIRSITSTAQITKAMQMVAASKMRKAQEAALHGRPFARLFYRLQRRVVTHAVDFEDPLLEVREVRRRGVILIGADKGLCGALSTNLFRVAAQFDPATTLFIAAGRKAAQFVARSGRQLVAEFPYGDTPKFPEARAIAACARDLFVRKEVDEVKPASRVPIALHWPVIEKGAAPGRPICPVMSARLLIALTVSVPLVLWFTPIVQPMNPAVARA